MKWIEHTMCAWDAHFHSLENKRTPQIDEAASKSAMCYEEGNIKQTCHDMLEYIFFFFLENLKGLLDEHNFTDDWVSLSEYSG